MVEKINVEGIAIREGISRNNIKYTSEELQKFTPTLIGRPILKDHIGTTDNTIGKVTHSYFKNNEVHYKGWIKDESTNEKVVDERITEVSIGAIAGRLVKESEDSDILIAKNIECMELSTTPTPGVRGTMIKKTLESIEQYKIDKTIDVLPVAENIDLFSIIDEKIKNVIKEGVVPMNPSDMHKDEEWHTPMLEDFTDKKWEDLSDMEKKKISMHFAWSPKSVPDNFTDLKLPHHRPSDGAAMREGVEKAMSMMSQTKDIPATDMDKVKSHLEKHMDMMKDMMKKHENMEVKKMSEEIKNNEKIVSENSIEFEKVQKELDETKKLAEQRMLQLKEMEETKKQLEILQKEKLDRLKNEYKTLSEQKGVQTRDVLNLSEDILKILIEDLSSIKVIETSKKAEDVSEKKELPKIANKTKGEVGMSEETKKVNEDWNNYVLTERQDGPGLEFYSQSYNDKKLKRLVR